MRGINRGFMKWQRCDETAGQQDSSRKCSSRLSPRILGGKSCALRLGEADRNSGWGYMMVANGLMLLDVIETIRAIVQ